MPALWRSIVVAGFVAIVILPAAFFLGRMTTFSSDVAQDTCIVELDLPAGATVTVDGRDHGNKRQLTFQSLERSRTSASKVQIGFAGGGMHERTLLLKGGWRIRLVLLKPDTARPELVLQTGHSSIVLSMAFSPDGRQVLSGSIDNTIRLWDAASGRELRRFEGHELGVNSVAFSPDGRQVLSGSDDGTLRLWDIATGDQLAELISLKTEGDWLVVTPEGLFDGSPAGCEKVMYRIGGGLDVVPVHPQFDHCHRPGLLAAILRGERPMPDAQ